MRAFVNSPNTNFLQATDVFSSSKFVYDDLDLTYGVGHHTLTDEAEILACAIAEFGDRLLVLFGKEKPLYIDSRVQCLSTGKKWFRLIDLLKDEYPSLEFRHDENFTQIEAA